MKSLRLNPILCLATWAFCSAAAQAVPASVTAPIDGPVRIGSTSSQGTWRFYQYTGIAHTTTGGVGGCDDTKAWDANLSSSTSNDADAGKPVYAVADGYVDVSIYKWDLYGANQVLLRHTDTNGTTYYSGYLHMRNIIAKVSNTFVRAGTTIGYVSNVGVPDGNNHLHFAVYDKVGSKLVSRNTIIQPRYQQPPSSLAASATASSVAFSWIGSRESSSRIQIASSGASWTADGGFAQPTAALNSTLLVNSGVSPSSASGYYSVLWPSSSLPSYRTPRSGDWVQWTVRQNTLAQGSSTYTAPQSLQIPYVMSFSVSPASLSAAVNQGLNAPSSYFNITSSGFGTTQCWLSSNQTWLNLSSTSMTLMGGSPFQIVATYASSGLAPGTYAAEINITSAGAVSKTLPVTLTVNSTGVTADDHSNTTAGASPAYLYSSRSGTIGVAGDVDYFYITLASSRTVILYSAGATDTTATLYNSSLGQIDYDDDNNKGLGGNYTSGANFLIIKNLAAGTYYLKVAGFSSRTGPYTLWYQ
ncbi:MAG: peptidoglycan DD-metalloendopeptidase family protein [Verrucomicrobiota bacterium]